MAFSNPSDDQLRDLLRRARTIAVVGYSPKPDRPSHGVAASLQRFGYRIVPIRPALSSGLGETAYPDLRAVPDPRLIDLVDVFRAPDFVDDVVDACIELRLPAIWLQLGVVNEGAAERATAAGMMTVMDRCAFSEYVRLCGAAPRCAP